MSDERDIRPFCPACEEYSTIAMFYSGLLGRCWRCQNCDEEFPLGDIDKLWKVFEVQP